MSLGNALNTAVSGLRAESLRVATAAHNIANVTTPDFVPATVATRSLVSGGVAVTDALVANEIGGVDIAQETTQLIRARAAYAHGLEVIRTTAAMLGERLDATA